MIKITSLSIALLALSLNAYSGTSENLSKADSKFYGIFTTDSMVKGCTISDVMPLRSIVSYRLSMTSSEVASWIDSKTGDFKVLATNNGMNAIVGFRENLSLSNSGGIVTFSGVGVKAECFTPNSQKAPTSKSGIPQY